jgi:hypothetical protein
MWRTSVLALLAMGQSVQAGFSFSSTSQTIPEIPHFRVVNIFAHNDGVGTGSGVQAMQLDFDGSATVWAQRVTGSQPNADVFGFDDVPWGSAIRLGDQPVAPIAISPTVSNAAWTQGITTWSVTTMTFEPDQQNTQQIARLVFANEVRLGGMVKVGGSSGWAVVAYLGGGYEVSDPSSPFPAPVVPNVLTIDRAVKVMNRRVPARPTEFGPVTVESISNLTGVEPEPITIESISPHLLNNIEWITDEPARKVFRLTNLSQEDWTLGTIFFTVPNGLGGIDRKAFTLIAPEPATLGVLTMVFAIGCSRERFC